jgi:hypothetical protein
MSVKELQARIVKISADIDLQKKVLEQLVKDKSAVQRQLNAVQDPVARLPLEISSKIFLECIPLPPIPGARFAPMLLLNVCHSWTNIALSTGALWAAICIEFSRRSQAKRQILKLWLHRARNYPLSITLINGLKNGAAPTLRRYTKQIRCLEIYEKKLYSDLTPLGSFPHLERLTIGAIDSEDTDEEDWSQKFSVARTIGFLGLAQNLVELTLDNVITESDYKTTQKLVLPSLVCLKFGELPKLHHLSDSSADDILCHISLPALEILAIPFTTISCSDFSLFLKRSSPPLQKLVLDGGSNSFAFTELDEWLRLVPSLTHLEFLVRRETSTDKDLFSALADSASHLLPDLRSLTIHNASPSLSNSSWQTLLCALSARRSRLLHFKFTWCEPPADVCAGLRRLVADGMDIHIGSNYENLISI